MLKCGDDAMSKDWMEECHVSTEVSRELNYMCSTRENLGLVYKEVEIKREG